MTAITFHGCHIYTVAAVCVCVCVKKGGKKTDIRVLFTAVPAIGEYQHLSL